MDGGVLRGRGLPPEAVPRVQRTPRQVEDIGAHREAQQDSWHVRAGEVGVDVLGGDVEHHEGAGGRDFGELDALAAHHKVLVLVVVRQLPQQVVDRALR